MILYVIKRFECECHAVFIVAIMLVVNFFSYKIEPTCARSDKKYKLCIK